MDFVSLESIAVFMSIIALFISIQAYRLSRKQPNENKIFDEKIRCYAEIIRVLNQTLNTVVTVIEDEQFIRKHKEDNWEEELLAIEEELYDAIYKFDDVVNESSLFIPSEILIKLEETGNLFVEKSLFEKYNTADKLEEYSNRLNGDYDLLVNALRHDIAFDALDSGLRSRLSVKRPKSNRRTKVEKI